jgi:hypothetical protein
MLKTKTNKLGTFVYTIKSWKKGEQIWRFSGKITFSCIASVHHSISINESKSFEWTADNLQSHINHSCDSNCFIDFDNDTPVLIAKRDICSDEEICYNYNAVEYNRLHDMIAFYCHCDTRKCVGSIRGYSYLTNKQKEDVADVLTPYIKSLLLS